jgi:uncharacterized protein (TIGR02117 family)
MLRNGLAMFWRWVRLLLALLALGIAAYALAVAVGFTVPANRGWVQADSGVRIYVIDNGIHTDLVLPLVAEGEDWRDLVKPGDLRDPRQAEQGYLAFGWGNRDFYLNTPSWSEMSPKLAIGALFGGGGTVLHVVHLSEPRVGDKVRTILLRPDEYRRLAAFVRGTFDTGPSVAGYGSNDAFYPAKGGYSAINTCNAWTGQALRAAGVTMGSWTPFPFGVMQWL